MAKFGIRFISLCAAVVAALALGVGYGHATAFSPSQQTSVSVTMASDRSYTVRARTVGWNRGDHITLVVKVTSRGGNQINTGQNVCVIDTFCENNSVFGVADMVKLPICAIAETWIRGRSHLDVTAPECQG